MRTRTAVFLCSYLIVFVLHWIHSRAMQKRKNRISRSLQIPIRIVNLGLAQTGSKAFCHAMKQVGFQTYDFTYTSPDIMFRKYGYNCLSDLPLLRRTFSTKDLRQDTVYYFTLRDPYHWLKSMRSFMKRTWNLALDQPFHYILPSTKFRNFLRQNPYEEYIELLLADKDKQHFYMVQYLQNIIRVFKKAKVPLYIIDISVGSDKYRWNQVLQPLRTYGQARNLAVLQKTPFPRFQYDL